MSYALSIAAWLIAAPTILLFSIFVLEVIAGLAPRAPRRFPKSDAAVAVIVPAHNEAGGIGTMLTALLPMLPPQARVLVVADNCDDATASRARVAGVDVVERNSPTERGKGYALAFAREALAGDPPACVVVLDADCIAGVGAVAALRDAVVALNRPVQGINLLAPDLAAPPMIQISNFAFMVKNLVRQRGAARLGAAAMLGGTGMALPWSIFATAPLASSNLVEDVALGLDATRSGQPPFFLESARVTSGAADMAATITQRTRWEHGFIATARRRALPLLAEGIASRRWSQIWAALHLCVPALAMLAIVGAITLISAVALAWLGGSWLPAITLAALMIAGGGAVFMAWLLYGRKFLTPAALVRLPFYVLWKLPIYLKLFRKPETDWVRTQRQGE